jgi:hypothetical protein
LNLTAENTTAASDAFLKIGEIKGESKVTNVNLSEVAVGGSLRVLSNAPLNLTAENTTAASDAYLKIGEIKGESKVTNVNLSEVAVGGSLTVRTGSGQESVQLEGIQVVGRTDIALGRGNDFLSIIDGVFNGFALLDGGPGEDTLLVSPDVLFNDGWRTVNWEPVSVNGRWDRWQTIALTSLRWAG